MDISKIKQINILAIKKSSQLTEFNVFTTSKNIIIELADLDLH